jgi:purine-nucleoside phosphorylase
MARQMGADAVGMSTVNEATLAASLGMRVAGFSCITNLATGILPEKLSHAEVTDVANTVRQRFADLLEATIAAI